VIKEPLTVRYRINIGQEYLNYVYVEEDSYLSDRYLGELVHFEINAAKTVNNTTYLLFFLCLEPKSHKLKETGTPIYGNPRLRNKWIDFGLT